MTLTPDASKAKKRPDQGGVPLWLPLVVSIMAVAVAVLIAVRICPTLSALVTPPDPVLPADAVLQSRESKGTEDSWLYTTRVNGCEVARFYEKSFGACVYDPNSGCASGQPNRIPGASAPIAQCGGLQSIAQYRIKWSAVISADSSDKTVFRVYREVN
jgi:hypothetical protein